MKPVLFDSNILVYAYNLDSPFYNKATELHRKVVGEELDAVVAVQNLLEFFSTITNPSRINKPQNPQTAKKSCLAYFGSGFKIIYPKEDGLEMALDLAKEHDIKGRKIFDVYLVATMLSNGIGTIYTANEQDFEVFDEIEVINPFK